ncbi:MAG: molybdenum cofactor guanylyltransferase [bacterium]|nr:molybdenum cofactor guanylyltransferase [bacterium]MDT8395688.1 molybdenum cofactor guanylyltransferase [bacterium]
MTPGVPFPGEVGAAVLVGGQSSRFGRDKVLLEVDGEPLVKRSITLLSSLFSDVLVIGHDRPEFHILGIRAIEDLIPGKGSLGGLYTAVMTAGTPAVFVMAADMPFVSASLIDQVVRMRGGVDAVIPRGPTGFEPLCALYSRSCAAPMKKAIDKGSFRIMAALEGLKITNPEIMTVEGEGDPFANINTPEDWERLADP